MKTIIVTGGAGFIGSHLCDLLIEKGNKVICLDNLGSGNAENIKHLLDNENFIFIKHNVIDKFETSEDIDQIYHLASRASPVDYQTYPVETALTNSIGTKNMLDLAKEKNATILFASTSEAYGEPKVHPQTEDYWGNVNPIGIRSCYDESKRFGEALMMAYMREYGTDIKIVRIFNTYGPRMRKDDGRVIPNFIMQALEDKDITIYGDGSQTRSFCYVSDLICGLYLMINSKYVGPKNLGNPKEYTILETAKKIKELIKSDSNFIFKELPKDDPTRRRPDITLARDLLDWEPKINFDDGLKKTVEFFKSINENKIECESK